MKGNSMAQDPVVEEDAVEEPPKKSKKKLIIIIAAVLALVLIGGGAAWYFMGHKSGEHKEAKDGKEEKESKDKEEDAHAVEPTFVKLETFTVNLNPEEGEKYLQVDMTLNATDKEEADFLGVHMPQVRNRVLLLLTSKKPSEITTMDGKKALSKELTEQINQPYSTNGKPLKVTGVFFTSFVIQ
jgi:flagellar protein FliL